MSDALKTENAKPKKIYSFLKKHGLLIAIYLTSIMPAMLEALVILDVRIVAIIEGIYFTGIGIMSLFWAFSFVHQNQNRPYQILFLPIYAVLLYIIYGIIVVVLLLLFTQLGLIQD